MLPSKYLFGIFVAVLVQFESNFAAQFHNPLADFMWPDPYCYLHTDGFYYMPRQLNNRGVTLFKSASLTNWRDAKSAVIYTAPEGLMGLWAPEIHFVNGNFYLYFAMDTGTNAAHRMYVIRALDPNNPMGNYTSEKKLLVPGADVWAIDGTLLQYGNGKLYFIWSGWPTIDAEFPQNLYIAPMSDPETISGPRVLIDEPRYPWQNPLLEGPQVLVHAGRTFVVYSANGSWGPDYCLGFLGIDDLKDPLVASNWWRHDQPIFWRNDEQSVYGVGHASFTTSKDGSENWIIYHGMQNPDGGWANRTARAQKFGWNPDQSPSFPRPLGFDIAIDGPSGE